MDNATGESLYDRLRREVEEYSNTPLVSSSHQNQRDRCQAVYEQFLLEMFPELAKRKDAMAAQMFPEDVDEQMMIILMFLISVSETVKGRNKTGGPITVQTLINYESHLVGWIATERSRRRLSPIDRGELSLRFRRTAKGLHNDSRLSTFGAGCTESLAGPNEVRKLIDYDLCQTPTLELAKGHHLAWCIGVQTGVRADSLGPDSSRLQYRDEDLIHLAWKDVVIERLSDDRLSAKMTFRKLKTNSTDIVTLVNKAKDASFGRKQLTTPKDVNSLVLSVPHRLAIIAIRRGILDGIETLQDFFNDQRQRLWIKKEHLEDPIIYASSERGLRMISQPASSSSLSTYLNNKGERLGFTESATFYSFRRYVASITETRVDLSAAQEMLDHKNARTTRKHYVKTRDWVDSTAISLGEEITGPNGKSQELIDRAETLLVTSLTPEGVKSIDDGNLSIEATEQLRATGEEFDKNAIRRLTQSLRQKAVADLSDKEARARTIQEQEKRLLDFQQCLFTDKLREIASRDNVSEIRALMTVLWSNPLNEYRHWIKNPAPCPICEEDDTIDDVVKAQVYSCPKKLHYHMHAVMHCPFAKWKRLVQQDKEERGADRLTCPFCKESNRPGAPTYSKMYQLTQHINDSNARNTNAKHDLLKTQAGWYEPGFKKSQDPVYRANMHLRNKRRIAREKGDKSASRPAKKHKHLSEPEPSEAESSKAESSEAESSEAEMSDSESSEPELPELMSSEPESPEPESPESMSYNLVSPDSSTKPAPKKAPQKRALQKAASKKAAPKKAAPKKAAPKKAAPKKAAPKKAAPKKAAPKKSANQTSITSFFTKKTTFSKRQVVREDGDEEG